MKSFMIVGIIILTNCSSPNKERTSQGTLHQEQRMEEDKERDPRDFDEFRDREEKSREASIHNSEEL